MKLSTSLRMMGAILVIGMVLPFPGSTIAMGGRPPAVSQAFDSFPGMAASTGGIEIRADAYDLPLAFDETAGLYAKPSVLLKQNDSLHFKTRVETEGRYTISFDVASAPVVFNAPEGTLLVDGQIPSSDAPNIVFPVYYQNSSDSFPIDRYGNEALIRQVQVIRWSNIPLRDVNFEQKQPVQINLARGEHDFQFTLTAESLYLGSIYIQPFSPYPDYNQALKDDPAPDSSGVSLTLEAEWPAFKNDTAVRPANDRSLGVTPYDTYRLLLNTLGGDSWQSSGSTVYYEVSVPQDGMYNLTLRALQNTRNNFTVFRRVSVNGAVPFEQLNELAFNYSPGWSDVTLGGATPFKIHLKKGTNLIGIEATDSPYRAPIEKIRKVLLDINNLALKIRKLTGNQVDPYKDWVISDYIPDLKDQLIAIADDLRADQSVLSKYNRNSGSQEIQTYQMAIDNILFLARDPDKVPVYLNRFSEGSGSAASLLGSLLPLLQSQPLALDRLTIHSPDVVISPVKISGLTSFSEGAKRFLASFQTDPYRSLAAGKDELQVWANRPRQYVDLMQQIADQSFTPETGIRVKFSIMPDESKLVLANAAGIQPDVAVGVSTNVPYELAIRNALYDLRSFPDFDSFIRIYSPGALLSYIINDSVYAIPETQDFWVTFYRRDILDSLGLPVPDTWDQVIEILPELQRYSMNFNTPLSSGSGMKGYLLTTPYIFNYGAQLYSPDGFSTGLNNEAAISAIKFMTDSFTIYGMPLTTSSFYNSFRSGSLPIGISNVETYIKLVAAAPELNGLWELSPYPATVLPDGTKNRYATGDAQTCIMFANTDRPGDAWRFMKWWMSSETQVDFEQRLLLNYGQDYLWFSANLEAFQHLPILEEHKKVILEQWLWLQEPVKLPGSYMEERELSNIWNQVVFDGVNPRVAIDHSTTIINREITRKMEEFGYLQDGKVVKQFKIPTIETVKKWMENAK